ncbi:MAG: hypothetical protein ACYSWU_15050, partial [Planctomycetota bacterium]
MKYHLLLIPALLALSPPLCPGAEKFKLEPGFVRLDNGKNLKGWFGSAWSGKKTGNVDGWSVVDGAICLKAKTAKNHLFSRKTYSRNVIIR